MVETKKYNISKEGVDAIKKVVYSSNASQGVNALNAKYAEFASRAGSADTARYASAIAEDSEVWNEFLRKGGDSSDGTYHLGSVSTPLVDSPNYTSGRGFEMAEGNTSGSPTSLTLTNRGGGTLPFYAKQASEVCDTASTAVRSFEVVYNEWLKMANTDEGAFVRFNGWHAVSGHPAGFARIGVRAFVKKVYELSPAVPLDQGDNTLAPGIDASPGLDWQWEEIGERDGDTFTLYLDSGGLTAHYSLKLVCEYIYNPRSEAVMQSSITLNLQGTEGGNATYYSGNKHYTSRLTTQGLTLKSGDAGIEYAEDGEYLLEGDYRYRRQGGAFVIAGNLLDFSLPYYDVHSSDVPAIRHVVRELMAANASSKLSEPMEMIFCSYIEQNTPDGLHAGCFSVRTTAVYIDVDLGRLHAIICAFGRNYHLFTEAPVNGTETDYRFELTKF